MRNELPSYINDALRTGEKTWETGGYSRNHLVFSIGMSAFQNGWSKEDFIKAVLNKNNRAGSKQQALPREKARNQLNGMWDRIADLVASNPPEGSREAVSRRLDPVKDVVLTAQWSGRTGNTDQHIMLSLLALGYELGTWTPALGVRTIAMTANVTAKTAMKSLSRLKQSGYLEEVAPSTHNESTKYGFTTPTVYNTPLTFRQACLSGVLKTETMGHDIFTRGALGGTALRLWTQLEYGKPYTAKQMSEILGLGEDVCRRAAHKLVEVGVADSESGRPMTFTFWDESDGDPAMLDMLLMELETWDMPDTPDLSGISGKGEKRAEKYEREREVRKLEFAHYDRQTDCFVDPVTGEVLDTSSLTPLNGSQSLSEALPDLHTGTEWDWFDRALEAS